VKCISKPFTQIDRDYKITSRELRQALELKGEIISMGLWQGRSPNDENTLGVSSEKDIWYITTKEVRK
jgi:hypothetical protein